MKRIWALIALKNLVCAKSRLAATLGTASRRTLTLAMARDVAAALARSSAIARVVMVSDIADLDRLIGIGGVRHFDTGPARGLNEDLTVAAAWAGTQGATHVLIAHADLPWLTPQAIDRFVIGAEGGPAARVRAAACKDGRGTNLLLAPLPLPLPLVFGRDSLARFRQTAATNDVAFDVVCDLPLAADIDEPRDLAALSAACALGTSALGGSIGRDTISFVRSLTAPAGATTADASRTSPRRPAGNPAN